MHLDSDLGWIDFTLITLKYLALESIIMTLPSTIRWRPPRPLFTRRGVLYIQQRILNDWRKLLNYDYSKQMDSNFVRY